jgi:tetratricopeptide (TPR) repeat protein
MRREAKGTDDGDGWRRLIEVARATDTDPWRNAVRSLIGKEEMGELRRLVDDRELLSSQPARSLYFLAQIVESNSLSNFDESHLFAVDLLKMAWRLTPDDARICQALGMACNDRVDKLRFSTAAAALKPRNVRSRSFLADAYLPGLAEGPSVTTMIVVPAGEELTPSLVGSRYVPRWCLVTREGRKIWYGPLWEFDPKSIESSSLDEAEAEYRGAIRLGHASSHAHNGLASVLLLQGKTQEAMREFDEGIRLAPDDRDLHLSAAKKLYLCEQFDQSIKILDELRVVHPGWDEPHILLGMIYHEKNQTGQAFQYYKNALLSSGNPDEFLAIAIRETGTPTEREAVYREAIRLYPEAGRLRIEFGVALCELGAIEGAIAAFQEAVRVDPEDPSTRQEVGIELAKLGRREEAMSEWRKVLALDPSSHRANALAWLLTTSRDLNLRDGEAAIEFATKACELSNWKSPACLDTLAAAYAEFGDFHAAVEWQSRAIELLEGDAEKDDYSSRLERYKAETR